MAVIVPCHIGPSPIPSPPTLAGTPDASIPRASLANGIVAVTAIITQSSEPDYRLKRKGTDDDNIRLEVTSNKRLKSTDLKDEDEAFFIPADIPVIVPTDPIIIEDDLESTLQQALALLASTSDPVIAATPEQTPVIVPQCDNVAPPARTRLSPLSRFSSVFSPDGNVDEEEPTIVKRLFVSPPPPRAIEPPLWKLACHARVQHIISMHGIGAIRETVRQEALRRPPSDLPTPLTFTTRQLDVQAPLSKSSDLCLHIYTPSNFVSSNKLANFSERNTELEDEVEDEVDMSFDLDDESDSEEDTDEDYEGSQSHDSLLDVKLELDSSHSDNESEGTTTPLSSPPPPQLIPTPILIPTVPPLPHILAPYPPPLPRPSSIPVWCLRAYPEPGPCGTPAKVAPWAQGVLTRECLRAQARSLMAPGQPTSHW